MAKREELVKQIEETEAKLAAEIAATATEIAKQEALKVEAGAKVAAALAAHDAAAKVSRDLYKKVTAGVTSETLLATFGDLAEIAADVTEDKGYSNRSATDSRYARLFEKALQTLKDAVAATSPEYVEAKKAAENAEKAYRKAASEGYVPEQAICNLRRTAAYLENNLKYFKDELTKKDEATAARKATVAAKKAALEAPESAEAATLRRIAEFEADEAKRSKVRSTLLAVESGKMVFKVVDGKPVIAEK